MAQDYPVFLTRFTLSIPDPDLPSPRYHTALFVQTKQDGSGFIHQVNGDITSPDGMKYSKDPSIQPGLAETFHSMTKLGVTDVSGYPESWDKELEQIPAPPQQKAFNVKTMRTEPFKSLEPLVFYEVGEERRALVKCTEWTLERAVPRLRLVGLIR